MNFLRGFIIFASLTVATIQARGSTRPDDYDEGKKELGFNSKVLLKAIIKAVKKQMVNQIKLMDEKIEHFYKLIIEEKNSEIELQKKLNQTIIENENELSQLKSKIVELKQSVNEKKNNNTVLQENNLELNQRIQECCKQILDRDGTRNIFEAIQEWSLKGVKYWHSKNPFSIYQKDRSFLNWTPLHYASNDGQLEIVQFLLSKGADVEAENSLNETPFILASRYARVDVVKALLDKGANIDHQASDKYTALHDAVYFDHLPVVKLLIERGADRSLRNMGNQTPLDLAKEKGLKSIVDYLSSL